MATWWMYRHLRRWLVDHPAIAGFEWRSNETPGASVPFVAAIILSYLFLTLLLHRRLLLLPSPSAATIRLASSAHNLLLLLLSAAMAAGCAISALAQAPSPRWIFCFPLSSTSFAAGPVFFWTHVFYFSKIYELLDTLLILLAGGRRLTFLHVYHHAGVVVMCYVWLATAQSLVPVALVTNAGVHVVMYAYYLSSSAGWRWRPRWKRAVTELQIVQFVFSFAVSVVFLWYHFAGGGCSGMKGWLFNAVFNASLLALFLDFHNTAYTAGGRKEGKKRGGRASDWIRFSFLCGDGIRGAGSGPLPCSFVRFAGKRN